MERKQIRQGDVLLIPVEKPEEELSSPQEELRIAGERTGHTHVLLAKVYRIQKEAIVKTYAYLATMAVLTHQEHTHVPVPEGWWEVRQQREYRRNLVD
jgi:hypothetical protein